MKSALARMASRLLRPIAPSWAATLSGLHLRFTDRAREAFRLANEHAKLLHRPAIATEHVLVGIAAVNGVGAAALAAAGVDAERVRAGALAPPREGPATTTAGKLPMESGLKRVVTLAIEEAVRRGDDHVGTEHLLIGLLRAEGSAAAAVLGELGLSIERAREFVRRVRGEDLQAARRV